MDLISQNTKIDSLLGIIKTSKQDTVQVNTLIALIKTYRKANNNIEAKKYCLKALPLSDKLQFKKGSATANNILANIYQEAGNYPKSLEHHSNALKLRKELGDNKGIADSYNNMANVYRDLGDYTQSLKLYFASIKFREADGDKSRLAGTYINIGGVYQYLYNNKKAIENYEFALKIAKEIGDKRVISVLYNNLGMIEYIQGDYKKGFELHLASLELRKELNDKPGIASSLMNIGSYYQHIGDRSRALENLLLSLKTHEELGNQYNICDLTVLISTTYFSQDNIVLAKKYEQKCLEIARNIGAKRHVASCYHIQAMCDSAEQNYRSALNNLILYKELNDSIYSKESAEKNLQMTAKYENEKKDSEIKLLNKDKEKQAIIATAESKKQNIIIWSVVTGLLLVLIFSGFIYNRWQITNKQKLIIEIQKDLVDKKQKEILDSIRYAKRIQQSLLPTEKYLEKNLNTKI
ncbi:MAG: tetratricopeptide repeat protein [Bacteroidia bacterium]